MERAKRAADGGSAVAGRWANGPVRANRNGIHGVGETYLHVTAERV